VSSPSPKLNLCTGRLSCTSIQASAIYVSYRLSSCTDSRRPVQSQAMAPVRLKQGGLAASQRVSSCGEWPWQHVTSYLLAHRPYQMPSTWHASTRDTTSMINRGPVSLPLLSKRVRMRRLLGLLRNERCFMPAAVGQQPESTRLARIATSHLGMSVCTPAKAAYKGAPVATQLRPTTRGSSAVSTHHTQVDQHTCTHLQPCSHFM